MLGNDIVPLGISFEGESTLRTIVSTAAGNSVDILAAGFLSLPGSVMA